MHARRPLKRKCGCPESSVDAQTASRRPDDDLNEYNIRMSISRALQQKQNRSEEPHRRYSRVQVGKHSNRSALGKVPATYNTTGQANKSFAGDMPDISRRNRDLKRGDASAKYKNRCELIPKKCIPIVIVNACDNQRK